MRDWNAPTCGYCHGTRRLVMVGRDRFWIEVNCWYCEGTGNEDGQAPEIEPPDPTERRPFGWHAAVAESGLCPQCLGQGEVISLAEGMRGRAPCPRCGPVPGAS
ncbi:hypothetical protein [Actinomadura rubrisoli]|uniref:Uncharacterized protein n=1 Tax=Actinomadura rubrisoli TaxID=2530368 RepID=A0A4R5BD80_9ACTN|nr:hypothetical protein [Actinomadura rubrisoli]TDD81512.1 hypothetical protein E1298_23975 [Actinomadura rubrisoli]